MALQGRRRVCGHKRVQEGALHQFARMGLDTDHIAPRTAAAVLLLTLLLLLLLLALLLLLLLSCLLLLL